MAVDLEDAAIVWLWPNTREGWSKRVQAPFAAIPIGSTSLPVQKGVYSGWPGVRTRMGRPPVPYADRVASLTLRVTNGDVVRWQQVAAARSMTVEDWLVHVARAAVGDA